MQDQRRVVAAERGREDPRPYITTNLARAVDHLGVAAEHITNLFAASRDVAATILNADQA